LITERHQNDNYNMLDVITMTGYTPNINNLNFQNHQEDIYFETFSMDDFIGSSCLYLFYSSSLIMFFIIAVVLGLMAGFTPTIVFAAAPLLAKRNNRDCHVNYHYWRKHGCINRS
jgi:hypothetical protein